MIFAPGASTPVIFVSSFQENRASPPSLRATTTVRELAWTVRIVPVARQGLVGGLGGR